MGCVHYKPENYREKIIDLALKMLNGIEVEPRNYSTLNWKGRKNGKDDELKG